MTDLDRKRYEGQIDSIDVRQTKSGRNAGSDFLLVKLKTASGVIGGLCFDTETIRLMRNVAIGSHAMLIIDEKPGKVFEGNPQTDRTIVGYTPMSGLSSGSAGEFPGPEPEQSPTEGTHLPKEVEAFPLNPPYISTDEQKNRNIHASVALTEAVNMKVERLSASEICDDALIFYKALRYMATLSGLEAE